MSTWVDFKKLRDSLDFPAVLRHYGVEVKLKGDQHNGFCPLPNHNGQKRSPSFSANMQKKIFQCFGCGAKGNLIEFAAYMEGLNPQDGRDLRKAALSLTKNFPTNERVTRTRNPKSGFKHEPECSPSSESKPEKHIIVNPPLDFELKDLDSKHPYLKQRGFLHDTISHFGLGHCSRGLLKERIAIPLHDAGGKLVGYAGRLVDENAISADSPKYLFPGSRERDGKILEFRKSEFVYNGFRISVPVDHLAVVEGFPSVWWLWQCGFLNTVALMGWACAEQQAKLITSCVKPNGHVWILSDGDEAGDRCATNVFQLVAPHRFIRWIKLVEKRQPTDCSREELQSLLFR